MKVKSMNKPNSIEIINIDNSVLIKLNKDIVEEEKEMVVRNSESLEDEKLKYIEYEYTQVSFKLDNRPNLKDTIESNFDLYFEYGLKLEKEREERKVFKAKLDAMINGEVVTVSENALNQIADLMIETMNHKCESETAVTQLAELTIKVMELEEKINSLGGK